MTAQLRVHIDRCETCVFRLKYPAETRERLFAQCERTDSYVACHKFSDDSEEERSDVVCRGFYDRQPYQTASMRLAHLMGIVVYIDEGGQEIACPIPQTRAMAGYEPRKAGKR